MRRDIFTPGDSILLLGEGNFSFSVAVLNLGIELELTATCFESILTKTQIENCEILKSRRVSVLSEIDATKIHEHSLLMTKKYDKIIFNFPHTGGKMKIHLNRELLRCFFLSASRLLSQPAGKIIVSLCSGQGADYLGKRIWTDSWQVVDMAGHASLLLLECSPFDWSSFPTYSNVGYRSIEKGFHSEDGVVHIFSLVSNCLSQQVDFVTKSYLEETNNQHTTRPFFDRRLKQSILQNNLAPHFFIFKIFEDVVSSKFEFNHCIESRTFFRDLTKEYIASSLQPFFQSGCEFLLYSFQFKTQVLMDFEHIPITTRTLLVGKDSCNILMTVVAKLLKTFKMTDFEVVEKYSNVDANNSKQFLLRCSNSSQEFVLAETFLLNEGNIHQPIVLVHIDSIIFKVFSLNSWKQLWAQNVHVNFDTGKPTVGGICPYPVSYTFDISFKIQKSFSEDNFLIVLWDLAGEIITSVVKLSEFCSDESAEKCLCYRVSYLSYDYPICRKFIVDFHQNVLSRALEIILGVCVK